MPATTQPIREGTSALVAALDDGQRQVACLAFDDERRERWTYLPGDRHGVPLHALGRRAAKTVHRLLAVSLSEHTHAQVTAIMGLEDVLDRIEGGERERHAGDYWLALYGDPAGEVFGWRLGGHHLGVHLHVVGDEVRATPLFLGANPARVAHGARTVSRPLAVEEDLGFGLLAALPDAARRSAIVDGTAPRDILSGAASRVPGGLEGGVRLGELDGEARRCATALVHLYVDRLLTPLASWYRDEVLPASLGDLRFAWAGATGPGTGHYYRVAGPRFLAELDNTQDGANHVHTVWRDPEGDFAADLLGSR